MIHITGLILFTCATLWMLFGTFCLVKDTFTGFCPIDWKESLFTHQNKKTVFLNWLFLFSIYVPWFVLGTLLFGL